MLGQRPRLWGEEGTKPQRLHLRSDLNSSRTALVSVHLKPSNKKATGVSFFEAILVLLDSETLKIRFIHNVTYYHK